MLKRVSLTLFFLFALIVGFSSLFIPASQVVGQVDSSSSGSSGGLAFCIDCAVPQCSSGQVLSIPKDFCKECPKCISTSSSSSSSGTLDIALNKNFTGIWEAKIKRSMSRNNSSSSSGECVFCIQVVPECSSDQVLVKQTCTECAHCESARKSRIITLKLCVKNEKLEGTVDQKGVVNKALVTSQTVISEGEVQLELTDKNGNIKNLSLKLVGEKQLTGTFEDGLAFVARKISPYRNCIQMVISSSSGSSLENCFSRSSCRGPNGTYLLCPEGTKCSGLPAYGCYPPDCPVPICLSANTKIKTPTVEKLVTELKKGDLVISDNGEPVQIIKTNKLRVKDIKILRFTFNDGTILEISPNHPTPDGVPFKNLKVGDIVDDRMVVLIQFVPYKYKYTYDILPDSQEGNYYANGILVGSTIKL